MSKLIKILALTAVSSLANATPYIVDQHNDGATPFQGYTNNVGQSFSPTDDYLDHVELQLNSQSASSAVDVYVEILDSVGGAVLGTSNTQSFTYTGLATTLGHFEFSVIDISAYNSLFLNVVADAGAAGVFLSGGFGGNPYAGGEAYASIINAAGAVELGFKPDSDLWFRTGVTAVPVPAAAWLFGSGLIGLWGVGQRKKQAKV